MRRTVTLVALWLAAAVVAVVVAWQGVAVVGDQVTDERPAPLAASEIETRLDRTSTTTATTTSTTTAAPPLPTEGSTPAAPPAAETRTYNLTGGTASLRFTPAGVEVVFANPAAGFSVEVEPEHGNGVKVEFESGSHESRVDGWWDGGPIDRIREERGD